MIPVTGTRPLPMEVRAFAERVLRSAALEDKLRKPDGALTDEAPGEAVSVS